MSGFADCIDHSILRPEADTAQVEMVVGEALRYHFASVCINGCHVERVAEMLAGTPVKTCVVVGYPLGASLPQTMAHETAELVKRGAQEIEFVAPLRYLMTQATDKAVDTMRGIVDAVRAAGAGVVVKTMIESAALMRDTTADAAESRIGAACDAARRAGCDFVISGTGQHPAGGTTVAAVRLMRKHAAGLRVKAGGGIRTYAEARQMLDAGADRLGSSCAVAILKGRPASAGAN